MCVCICLHMSGCYIYQYTCSLIGKDRTTIMRFINTVYPISLGYFQLLIYIFETLFYKTYFKWYYLYRNQPDAFDAGMKDLEDKRQKEINDRRQMAKDMKKQAEESRLRAMVW